MKKILLVSSWTLERESMLNNLQNFPPRVIEACWQYKYDEELRDDPTEYQRIYEELKVEAALVTIVSVKRILVMRTKF